jgi:hypothetical protein
MKSHFLSHSSADNDLAWKMYRWLRDRAVSAWFDRIELQPGDSLLSKIAAGITSADVLLVLVTKSSIRSPWVEKELSIALTQEVAGTGPKVIPLLARDCEIPTILADKLYISIDKEQSEFDELIPAIFRDSYILDITLHPQNLGLNISNLRDNLHDYYRSNFNSIRVRINNHDFNKKVSEIAEKTISAEDTPAPAIEQIKRKSTLFQIYLRIYWTNLSELLAQLASEVFTHFGKNLDALQVAMKSIDKTWQYSHYILSSHLDSTVFPVFADSFDFPEIASFMRRYEDYEVKKLVQEICELKPGENMAYVGLVGSRQRKVIDGKLYLPRVSENDMMALQFGVKVTGMISYYTWYVYCLPQIIGKFLFWTAFREGKPLHELEYFVGFKIEDYGRIGME